MVQSYFPYVTLQMPKSFDAFLCYSFHRSRLSTPKTFTKSLKIWFRKQWWVRHLQFTRFIFNSFAAFLLPGIFSRHFIKNTALSCYVFYSRHLSRMYWNQNEIVNLNGDCMGLLCEFWWFYLHSSLDGDCLTDNAWLFIFGKKCLSMFFTTFIYLFMNWKLREQYTT